jgi:tetratricopeptide (TPR) repeat protein
MTSDFRMVIKWPIILNLLGMLMMAPSKSDADKVESTSDLAKLPAFCRGTMMIRKLSQDPIPWDVYLKKYGESWMHLHHYCWALNAENHAVSISNTDRRRDKLRYAIGDIDYVLSNNKDPNFYFLPEIYTSKARILFKLDDSDNAVIWLKKAIDLKPSYVPAYARLSDYYVDRGEIDEAIKILNQGIARNKRSDMLTRRLREIQSKD